MSVTATSKRRKELAERLREVLGMRRSVARAVEACDHKSLPSHVAGAIRRLADACHIHERDFRRFNADAARERQRCVIAFRQALEFQIEDVRPFNQA